MPDDVIGTPEAKRSIVCEFCESSLSQAGELIKRSGKARAFIDLDDDNAKLRARVEALQAENAQLKQDLQTAREQGLRDSDTTRRGFFSREAE